MATQDKGRAIPKFGEWDVNNPASAEGFTVIFNKARDEKNTAAPPCPPRRTDSTYNAEDKIHSSSKRRWFCCGYVQFVGPQK